MKDMTFKSLKHKAKGYEIFKTGSELSSGYKPDVVLKKRDD